MSAVTQAASIVDTIEQKVRHLTNSPGENVLKKSYIQQTINDIYQTDFPYAIKLDQLRRVYTIYTQPNIDVYPIDVNYYMGVRAPIYFDGVQGGFYKDRGQFFNLWPKFLTQFEPASGDGSTTSFSFTIQGPFLRNDVIIGGVDTGGNYYTIRDGGDGVLYLLTANAQSSTPAKNNTTSPPIQGLYNENLGNPGLYASEVVGSVNYVSGAFSLNFAPTGIVPGNGELITVRVSQYQTGRPYSMLFFNNEIILRPVPDKIHKVEFNVYQTPVQFMTTTDHPLINQWWKYIAYLVACEIQRERNDFDAVLQLQEGAKRQEALVLERQAVEEIGQPTVTIFNSSLRNPYSSNFWGMGFY